MRMDRRAFIGLSAVPFLPRPVFEEAEADLPLWFDFPGDERSGSFTVGTVGQRSTCCVERILDQVRKTFGTDPELDPVVRQGLEPRGDRGVIAADIELLIPGKWLARLEKGTWGLAIVPSRTTTEVEVRRALDLVTPMSAWTTLAFDPFSATLLPGAFETVQVGVSLWSGVAVHIQKYPALQKALGALPQGALIAGTVVEGKKSVMLTGDSSDHEEPGMIGALIHIVHPPRLREDVAEYLSEVRGRSSAGPVPCLGLSSADPDFPDFGERVRKAVLWCYQI